MVDAKPIPTEGDCEDALACVAERVDVCDGTLAGVSEDSLSSKGHLAPGKVLEQHREATKGG